MAGSRIPGPLGTDTPNQQVDEGTLARVASLLRGPVCQHAAPQSGATPHATTDDFAHFSHSWSSPHAQQWRNAHAAAAPEGGALGPTLKAGARGAAVSDLQARLNAQRPNQQPLTTDGIFGPKTDAVVRDIQRKHHLKVDGIVGPVTWIVLPRVIHARSGWGPSEEAPVPRAAARVPAPKRQPEHKPPAERPPEQKPPADLDCAAKKGTDDKLSTDMQKIMQALTGQPVQATGMPPNDGGPMMYSADSTFCQKQAYQLGPTLRRFNRYREALPYAYAANNMAEIKKKREPNKPLKAAQPPADSCMQRLSSDPDELCDQLKLPKGTISEEDLRDDKTGFLAAVYRDQATGKPILVTNDTDPQSLVDWKTNLMNSAGHKTDQYTAAQNLATKLKMNGVDYDIAGYSKGGGMAQLMGLQNEKANVVVFNSAGLPDNVASSDELASLSQRTKSYSAEGDLLTYMNETRDPAKLVENAKFLKKELMGENWVSNPMKVDYRNPENPKGENDPEFASARKELADLMDLQIAAVEKDGKPPPPVRAAHKEVVKDSDKWYAKGSKDDEPSLGKQIQHQMSHVLDPMKTNVDKDREALEKFRDSPCGSTALT